MISILELKLDTFSVSFKSLIGEHLVVAFVEGSIDCSTYALGFLNIWFASFNVAYLLTLHLKVANCNIKQKYKSETENSKRRWKNNYIKLNIVIIDWE